jgi:hypothetical protein
LIAYIAPFMYCRYPASAKPCLRVCAGTTVVLPCEVIVRGAADVTSTLGELLLSSHGAIELWVREVVATGGLEPPTSAL